jgi:hypothetical protein
MNNGYRNGADLVRPFEPDYPGRRNPWNPRVHPENFAYIQAIIDRVDSEMVRPPKYGDDVKLEVYKLRDQGLTLREIAEKVGVSKSTACLYVNKYKKQQEALRATVKQPGTDKTIETHYSLNEVNVGKIKPKTSNSEVSNA